MKFNELQYENANSTVMLPSWNLVNMISGTLPPHSSSMFFQGVLNKMTKEPNSEDCREHRIQT